MNTADKRKLHRLLESTEAKADHVYELTLGFLRYEYVRTLNPRQFQNIFEAALKEKKSFDELVTEQLLKGHQ